MASKPEPAQSLLFGRFLSKPDLLSSEKDAKLNAPFVGSITYIQKEHSNLNVQETRLVINDQQRLTTLILLLAALVNDIEKQGEAKCELVDRFSPRTIRNDYLLAPEEDGSQIFGNAIAITQSRS